MKSLTAVIVVAALAGAAAAQHDHVHLTVDTESGQQGDQISIETGWYSGEENISIGDDGYVYHHNDIFVAHLMLGEFEGDPWDGRWYGATPRLTSDFFFPTGRLNGGDFNIELVDVRPVSGNGAADFGWAENHDGNIMNVADSAGLERDDRSFWIGTNRHMHHQIQSATELGMWDVTLVAWDANGRYTDSAPVHLRFHVVPAPAGLGALAIAGLAATRRRRHR